MENIHKQCSVINVIKRRQVQPHAKTQTAKTICRYRKVKSLNTENYFIIEHLVNNSYLFKVCFEIVNFAFIQWTFLYSFKKKYFVFVWYLLHWFHHFWIITFNFQKKRWPVTKQDLSAILNNQILPGSKPVWLVWPCSLIGSQSSLCSSSI